MIAFYQATETNGGLCMDVQERKQLIEEMRTRLRLAVEKAKGDFQTPEVYILSRKLDHMIIEYMRCTKQKND